MRMLDDGITPDVLERSEKCVQSDCRQTRSSSGFTSVYFFLSIRKLA